MSQLKHLRKNVYVPLDIRPELLFEERMQQLQQDKEWLVQRYTFRPKPALTNVLEPLSHVMRQ